MLSTLSSLTNNNFSVSKQNTKEKQTYRSRFTQIWHLVFITRLNDPVQCNDVQIAVLIRKFVVDYIINLVL